MLTEEQEKLLEDNIKLAYRITNKWSDKLRFVEKDEILSVVLFGLLKSCIHYKPEKSKFSTFACRVMENEILQMLRAAKKHRGIVSLYETTNTDNNAVDSDNYLMEHVELKQSTAWEKLYHKHVLEVIESLPDRERYIFKEVYFNDKEQRLIAMDLGISQSYVSRMHKKVLLRLRRKLGDMNG